jgi:uncharacterized membrane protein
MSKRSAKPSRHGAVLRHLVRHRFFYIAAALAVAAGLGAPAFGTNAGLPGALGGDVFYCAYLVLTLAHAFRGTPEHLREVAESEDEGILLIILITLSAILFSLVSLFMLLDRSGDPEPLLMGLSIASAPLGWLMLHTVAAFHYAHRYYAPGRSGRGSKQHGLDFPGTDAPDSWDFLYFAFVVGMTAQVSDVAVRDRGLRQFVWLHGLVSFFFNTVLIALAVNIAANLAAGK